MSQTNMGMAHNSDDEEGNYEHIVPLNMRPSKSMFTCFNYFNTSMFLYSLHSKEADSRACDRLMYVHGEARAHVSVRPNAKSSMSFSSSVGSGRLSYSPWSCNSEYLESWHANSGN